MKLSAWFRRRGTTHPTVPSAEADEAKQELSKAKAELARSTRQAAEGERLAGRLRRVNEENHFAQRALEALRGVVQ